MSVFFKKAERKNAKLRLAIAGPTGSGKTYTALVLAKGIGGRIAAQILKIVALNYMKIWLSLNMQIFNLPTLPRSLLKSLRLLKMQTSIL